MIAFQYANNSLVSAANNETIKVEVMSVAESSLIQKLNLVPINSLI